MMSNAIRLWREKVTGDFPHLEGLPQLPWPWSSLPGQVIDEISVSLGKVPCFRKLEFMDGSRFPLPCYLNSYLLVWHEVGICEDLPSERCISPEQRSHQHTLSLWLGEPSSAVVLAGPCLGPSKIFSLDSTLVPQDEFQTAFPPSPLIITNRVGSQLEKIPGNDGDVGGFETRGGDWIKETGSLTQWGTLGRNSIKSLENACFLLLSLWELIRGFQSSGGEPWKEWGSSINRGTFPTCISQSLLHCMFA